MKKHILFKINIIICLIVISIFLSISYLNYNTYCKGIENRLYEINATHSYFAFVNESAGYMVMILAAIMSVVNSIIVGINRYILKSSSIDELTGLPNRKYLNQVIQEDMPRYQKEHSTIFILDIDHFKYINDTLGHPEADKILVEIGSVLRKVIKEPNIIARWGGDEFVGIIYSNKDEAKKLLEELRQEVSSNCLLKKHSVTASIGVDVISSDNTMDNMLVKADKALYKSKDNGRNCVTFWGSSYSI